MINFINRESIVIVESADVCMNKSPKFYLQQENLLFWSWFFCLFVFKFAF